MTAAAEPEDAGGEAKLGGESPPWPPEFLGHPKGLWFLSFTEAWERFSFYGMQALLVLYMVKYLLLPGHIEHVVGFDAIQKFYPNVHGQALASQIFGNYTALVYLTPILGGLIADWFLGQ